MRAGFALPRDAGRRPALQGAAPGSGGGIRCGRGAARTWAWRSVMCAGFALPRDAGRRPALHKEKVRHALWHGAVSCARVSRSRAMPVGDRRSTRKRRGPGERWRHPVRGGVRHALWHGAVSCALVSRSRAMPVRDRRSTRKRCGTHFGMAQCHARWFRAPARCRSETGAPCPRKKGAGPKARPPRCWVEIA